MTTRLVLSKGVFGNGYTSGGGSSGSSCSLRRGTLISATWTENSTIYASVLLDGNDTASIFSVDWNMNAGQRVAVLFFGAQALVLPVASAIIEQALAQANEDMQDFVDELVAQIEQAKAEVEADLNDLNEAFSSFKETHQLTDDDITVLVEQTSESLLAQISGAIQTANEAYEALTALEQTVAEISITAQEKYEAYDTGLAELQAQITVASDAIVQEVSDRREAVNGAIADLTSLIEQTADGILSTVAGTYVTSDGLTAEVSTQVSQLTNSWSVKINNAVTAADDAAKTATDYLEYSTDGLTIGRKVNNSYTGYRTRITTSEFQVLDESENVLSSFGSSQVLLGNNSTSSQISLCGGSMLINGSSSGYGGSIANSKGAMYGFSTLDDAESYPVIQSNSGSSRYVIGTHINVTDTNFRQIAGFYGVYSNSAGTSGSFTLSESTSSSYLKALIFIYGDGIRYLSHVLWEPNNKYTTLERTVYNSSTGTLYIANAVYLVSGTSVTRQASFSGSLDISSSSQSVTQADTISVYAVLAIK